MANWKNLDSILERQSMKNYEIDISFLIEKLMNDKNIITYDKINILSCLMDNMEQCIEDLESWLEEEE